MAADILLKNLPSPLPSKHGRTKEGEFLPLEKGGEEGFYTTVYAEFIQHLNNTQETLKRVQGDEYE
jgi:hypothetical protein